jgi:hypothetical protein
MRATNEKLKQGREELKARGWREPSRQREARQKAAVNEKRAMEAKLQAEEDRDNADGSDSLGFDEFFRAVFELCDLWAHGTDAEEYRHLINDFHSCHKKAEQSEYERRQNEAEAACTVVVTAAQVATEVAAAHAHESYAIACGRGKMARLATATAASAALSAADDAKRAYRRAFSSWYTPPTKEEKSVFFGSLSGFGQSSTAPEIKFSKSPTAAATIVLDRGPQFHIEKMCRKQEERAARKKMRRKTNFAEEQVERFNEHQRRRPEKVTGQVKGSKTESKTYRRKLKLTGESAADQVSQDSSGGGGGGGGGGDSRVYLPRLGTEQAIAAPQPRKEPSQRQAQLHRRRAEQQQRNQRETLQRQEDFLKQKTANQLLQQLKQGQIQQQRHQELLQRKKLQREQQEFLQRKQEFERPLTVPEQVREAQNEERRRRLRQLQRAPAGATLAAITSVEHQRQEQQRPLPPQARLTKLPPALIVLVPSTLTLTPSYSKTMLATISPKATSPRSPKIVVRMPKTLPRKASLRGW